MKVVVKRSEWYRGKGSDASRLMNSVDMKCCLGFAALAMGATEGEIRGVSTPAKLCERAKELRFPTLVLPNEDLDPPSIDVFYNNDICCSMMNVNDSMSITDSSREGRLIASGKLAGIEFEFVD